MNVFSVHHSSRRLCRNDEISKEKGRSQNRTAFKVAAVAAATATAAAAGDERRKKNHEFGARPRIKNESEYKT